MSRPQDCTVIVVTHHRPGSLVCCLAALSGQGAADIVVVGPAGTEAPAGIQIVSCEARNISMARNLGLARARTPLVAFIDDDAVAQPGWLGALTFAFSASQVHAATGWTRAGARPHWQFRGERITRLAEVVPLPPTDQPRVHRPTATDAPITLGTNCAFRREALEQVGAFDPGFRYFLDESDLNMRLAAAGLGATAVVPDAVVHHHRAPGLYRNATGRLHDHREIGASLWRFLVRHAPAPDRAEAWNTAVARQLRPIIARMIGGTAEPRDVHQVRAHLHQGRACAIQRLREDYPI